MAVENKTDDPDRVSPADSSLESDDGTDTDDGKKKSATYELLLSLFIIKMLK